MAGGSGPAASIYAPENWSQRRQRSEMTFEDDHGREYYGTIELKTGDVTGLMQPQFFAPLMPEQKYLRRVPKRPYSLKIDYEQWKADRRNALKDWEKEGRQRAQKIHGSEYRPGAPFSSEVLDIIGPKPPAVDPVIAAQQGNRWVLGLTKKVDERLVEFFEPEDLDPELRRAREPDYTDRYIDNSRPRVGRGGAHGIQEKTITVPMSSARPRSRDETRAEGTGKEQARRREPRPKTGASTLSGRARDEKGRLLKKEA